MDVSFLLLDTVIAETCVFHHSEIKTKEEETRFINKLFSLIIIITLAISFSVTNSLATDKKKKQNLPDDPTPFGLVLGKTTLDEAKQIFINHYSECSRNTAFAILRELQLHFLQIWEGFILSDEAFDIACRTKRSFYESLCKKGLACCFYNEQNSIISKRPKKR